MLSPNKRVRSLSFTTEVFSSQGMSPMTSSKQDIHVPHLGFTIQDNPDGWYKDQKFKNFELLLLFTNAPVLDKKIWLKQLGHVKQIWIKSNHAYIWLVKTLMNCISTLIYFASNNNFPNHTQCIKVLSSNRSVTPNNLCVWFFLKKKSR